MMFDTPVTRLKCFTDYRCRRAAAVAICAASAFVLYLPAAQALSWSAGGTLATARTQHTMVVLENGKILAAGGLNTGGAPVSSAEIYTPASNSWSAAAPMATARYGAASATINALGHVIVTGGFDNASAYLASTELYNPSSNTWTPKGALITGRYAATATLMGNGDILITGGEPEILTPHGGDRA